MSPPDDHKIDGPIVASRFAGTTRGFVIFAYGLFSIAAQTLIFREFVTSFESNDITIGIFFGCWFLYRGAFPGLYSRLCYPDAADYPYPPAGGHRLLYFFAYTDGFANGYFSKCADKLDYRPAFSSCLPVDEIRHNEFRFPRLSFGIFRQLHWRPRHISNTFKNQ